MMAEALHPGRSVRPPLLVAVAALIVIGAVTAIARLGPAEDRDRERPATASAISPGISAGCRGVHVRADDDLVTAIALAPRGSTICIHRGRHEIGSRTIVPKSGMTLIGAQTRVDPLGHIFASSKIVGTSRDGVIHFENRATGVVIRNLDLSGASGIKSDLDRATKQHGRGINGGGGQAVELRVAFVRIHDNSSLGLGGLGPGAVLNRVELDHNGSDSYLGCCSGGIKSANPYAIYRSHIHDNIGNGIWQDVCGTDLIVMDSRIIANSYSGVRYEHNRECAGHASITHNVIVGNNLSGGSTDVGGIIVNSAPGAEVAFNHLGDNGILGISIHGNRGPVLDTSIHDNFMNGDPLVGCEQTGVECGNNLNLSSGDRTALVFVSRSSIPGGGAVVIGGQIAGVDGCRATQQVFLESDAQGGGAATPGPSTTDADGSILTTVSLDASTVFRVVAPATDTCSEAVSEPVTVRVDG